MEKAARTWQVRELFDGVWRNSLDGIQWDQLTMSFPEYLPPVLLSPEAQENVCKAAAALCRCASSADRFMASAHYEDGLEPGGSCVVLSLEVRADGGKVKTLADRAWGKDGAVIAQELLSSHVGLVMAASEDGLGFELRLPVHRSDCRSTLHRNAILLVEDETFVRDASCEVLEAAGYKVIATRDAEEALQVFECRRKTICAVISDFTLPGMSGKELARALHASLAAVPILLTSGYTAPVLEDRSRRLYYLAKPYNPASLLAAVRRCLESYHGAPFHGATTDTAKPAIEYCS